MSATSGTLAASTRSIDEGTAAHFFFFCDDALGVSAHHETRDAIADANARDARADFDDFARSIAPEYRGQVEFHAWTLRAFAQFPIDRIDARRDDAHFHFTGSDVRLGHVAHFELIDAAESEQQRSFHFVTHRRRSLSGLRKVEAKEFCHGV